MLTITGKTLITSDWHWGLKNDSPSRLGILVKVTQNVISYCKENNVKNIVFCGDWMHSRNQCNVLSLDHAHKCLEKIARNVNFYFVIGNHDIFYKNNSNITSARLFKNIRNVHIVSEATECEINGKKCLLCPWFSDLSKYEDSTFDMIFGHFDISHQFLMAQYIENHRSKNITGTELLKQINNDTTLNDLGLDDMSFTTENEIDTFMNNRQSSEMMGNWVNVVKEKGTIFAGHIHNRSELYTNGRKFIFIGSPYQQNLGEKDSEDGFYVMNEDGSYFFNPLTTVPRHIDLDMGKISENIDGFDFSIVKGNIIRKVYDVEIDYDDEKTINQKILAYEPYEELNSHYNIVTSRVTDGISSEDGLNSISTSELEYLKTFVFKTPDEVLMKMNTPDRDRIMRILSDTLDEVTMN